MFHSGYGTVICPCEPYSPEQKGKVESGVKYMQINFVSGRTFVNEADLKAKLKDWMDNYANKRVHGTTKKVPYDVLLNIERPALQPLPVSPFAFFNRSTRKVKPNCHINFENNYYSVPFAFVGKEVTVRWNDALVRIIAQGEQVAMHPRATGEGNYITERIHLPDYKVYSESERQVKYETKMREIGEDAHEYFRWLLSQKENYWFVTVRGIIGLTQTHDKTAVNLSLKRARFYQVRSIATIRNILEKKLYSQETEPKLLDGERIVFIKDEVALCRDISYYCAQI